MSESLNEQTVRKVADLARLRLDDGEIASLGGQLTGILDHVGKLESLDVTDVEPMAHPLDLTNRLAADEPGPVMPPEALLRNAPAVRGQYLDVPRVLGGEDSS